jgi:acyl-CoA synthetase (AMP-forming)/AMP-acid ligase II
LQSTNLCRFQADRLAAGLLQLGLSPGDRLGIWGPNSSEWYISRFASGRAGLIAVSTNFFIIRSHVNIYGGTLKEIYYRYWIPVVLNPSLYISCVFLYT